MIIIHTECDGASRATTRIQTTDALRVVAEDARDRDIIRMDEHSLIGKVSETVLYFEAGVNQQKITEKLREHFPGSIVKFL